MDALGLNGLPDARGVRRFFARAGGEVGHGDDEHVHSADDEGSRD